MGVAVTTVQNKSTTTEYVPGSMPPTGWAYHPDVPIQMNPLFSWPPKPVASWRWLKSIWLTLSSTLIILLMAILCTRLFLPATAEMASLEPGWVAGIWARNIITLFMVAGGLHWYFYQYKGQGREKKFDSRDFATNNKLFLFNNQVHDNMFWGLVSGVSFMTLFEVLLHWAFANGWSWQTPLIGAGWPSTLWYLAMFPLIAVWSSFHFYWVHRFLHWPPLYRLAHALHHKNINTGPWSGVSMHPIEHALYYSSLLIHLVVPSEPIHIVYHALGQTLFPAFSHSGFADLIAAGRERLRTGDFFHQLHHRHFECNYGTIEMPWDQWFGSFDDGTKEGRLAQRTRVRAMGRTVGVNKPSRSA